MTNMTKTDDKMSAGCIGPFVILLSFSSSFSDCLSRPMLYLIDGYNLLNVAGVPVPVRGRANLEKARLALLNFLAESLDPDEVPQTVVVFDAHDPPPGLPREMRHKGLLVRFARPRRRCRHAHRRTHPRGQFAAAADGRLQRSSHSAGGQTATCPGGR